MRRIRINGILVNREDLGGLSVITVDRPKKPEEEEKAKELLQFLKDCCCGSDLSCLPPEERRWFDSKYSLVFTGDSYRNYVLRGGGFCKECRVIPASFEKSRGGGQNA